jgi:hypothetical protein
MWLRQDLTFVYGLNTWQAILTSDVGVKHRKLLFKHTGVGDKNSISLSITFGYNLAKHSAASELYAKTTRPEEL